MTAPTRDLVEATDPSTPLRPVGPQRPGSEARPSAAVAAARAAARRRGAARWTRRSVTAMVTITMLAYPFLLTDPRSPWANLDRSETIALYSDGVSGSGSVLPTLVPAGTTADYLPGSRVLDPGPADPDALAVAEAAAAESRAWLASGTVPGGDGPYADMAEGALLDMRALLLNDGASVAGWSARWRYVWPRDASFVAVAMATTGHPDEAIEILSFLQRVQHRNGSFEARYLPDGSGPPDDRGIQADGTGWALWATQSVLASMPDADRLAAARALRPLIDRSTEHLLDLTDRRDSLPRASSDFWEVGESRLTLGTAAPILSGLEAAARLNGALGQRLPAEAAAERASDLHGAIVDRFGPRFARYTDGLQRDAAGAFLLPPFQPEPVPGALASWRASAREMSRPAGGLAPGAGWKKDGISWTPQTSLYGLTAAWAGDTAAARSWLTWLDAHRTSSGAIPEKVLGDGSPAAVAPLSWSAACVVLAVAQLDEVEAAQALARPESPLRLPVSQGR
ncbi:glycoside hydrolase family 15 [Pengzhenrongella frigida]|uniref:Glycoside hydrolase family 15 n=1 Tax=Pengzhenrongella frigida TaxID=1259133 RepID=A0A4Q5MZG4_9MICO|nr:glycoside hydrolase family 15 [Cellulomonas sp. HLT2-17]RYV51252.1 glycoside hydrolase family 15 [Cellulomonas sp. HLT2-17]